jgi:hypothetical protein
MRVPMALHSEFREREVKGWILPVSFLVFAFVMIVLKQAQRQDSFHGMVLSSLYL